VIAVNRDNDPGLAEQTGDGSEYVADLHDMACSDPRHRPIGPGTPERVASRKLG